MKQIAAWARMRLGSRWKIGPISISDFSTRQATLDVGEGLVALHDLSRREIGGVGDQQQLAVHQPGVCEGLLVDVVAEELATEVHAQDARHVRVADLAVQARGGAAVGELAPAGGLARVLRLQPLRPRLCLGFEFGDESIALGAGLLSRVWIVRDDQAQAAPACLAQHLLGGRDEAALQRLEQLDELGVASAGHREDELERAAAGQGDGL